ncbi:hypothetical protein HN385_05975 [archaeon]|jgi:hypothetical protein|nr:hypothetical protein [archaeon]MBT6868662.1 hypothetical protein [archaeon]MBT7193371.1 hypothetical protein [archaeon]MBT7381459.1 hypothetical protein [archaeon]MBT7508092.1 hypothetical protein [archaeon]
MIVTDVIPIGDKQKTRLYCNPGGVINLTLPHTIYSKGLSHSRALELSDKILNEGLIRGNVEIVKLGNGRRERNTRYIIQIEGDRDNWKHLPYPEFFGKKSGKHGDNRDNARHRLEEKLGSPFVEIDENLNRLGRVSVDRLLDKGSECWDIETGNYDNETFEHINNLRISDEKLKEFIDINEITQRKDLVEKTLELINNMPLHVYNIGFSVNLDKLQLYTIYDVPNFELKFLGKTYPIEVIRCNLENIIKKFVKGKKESKVLTTTGQNFMSYDMLMLREISKNFSEGFDKSKPVVEAVGGFFKRVVTRYKHCFDTASDSQHYNIGTINNKLFTIFKHFFGSELSLQELEEVKKDLSYQEQTTLRIESLLGNQESAMELAKYCMKDVIGNHMIVQKVLEQVYDCCYLFERSPEVLCTASRKRLPVRSYERKYIKEMNTLPSRKFRREFEEFDHEEQKIDVGWKKGYFQNCDIVYPTLLLKTFLPIILQNPEAKKVYEKQLHCEDKNLRMRYLLSLQSWLKKVNFDLIRMGPEDKWFFQDEHEIPLIETHKQNIEIKKEYQRICNGAINFSKYFTIIKDGSKLEKAGLGLIVNQGRVLSIGKRKFAWYSNNNVYSQGISLSGNKGDMCFYERDLFFSIVEKILVDNDINEAITKYEKALDKIEETPIEDLLIIKKISTDPQTYSSLASRREFIRQAVLHGIDKGETFGYGYSQKGVVLATNFQDVDFPVYRKRLIKKLNPIMKAIGYNIKKDRKQRRLF